METRGIADRITIRDRRVEVRDGGGGCLTVVGIMVVLAGFAPIIAVVFGGFSVDEPVIFVWSMIAAVCLFFTAFGAVLIFGRLRVDIDGNARTYRRRLSIFVTIKEKSGSLDEFDKVTLSRETRTRRSGKGSSSSYTVYPIRLVGAGENLKVRQPHDLS